MDISTIIVIAVIVVIIGLALFKIIWDKKKYPDIPPGCAGCPYSRQGNCGSCQK